MHEQELLREQTTQDIHKDVTDYKLQVSLTVADENVIRLLHEYGRSYADRARVQRILASTARAHRKNRNSQNWWQGSLKNQEAREAIEMLMEADLLWP